MTRAARIRQLAATIAAVSLKHPTRVAIDGVDGVGKTTLADELSPRLWHRWRPAAFVRTAFWRRACARLRPD